MLNFLRLVCLISWSTLSVAANLSLEEAITLSWNTHPSLILEAQEVEFSDQVLALEQWAFEPQMSLGASAESTEKLYFRSRASIKSPYGTLLEVYTNEDHWRVSLIQPLLKGRTRNYQLQGLRTAQLNQMIAKQQYEFFEQALLEKMVLAYRSLQLATLNLNLQARLLTAAERMHDSVQQKVKLGQVALMEGTYVQLQVEKERFALQQVRDQLAVAWAVFWDTLALPVDPNFDSVTLPSESYVDQIEQSIDLNETIEIDVSRAFDEDALLNQLNFKKQLSELALQKAREDTWWNLDFQVDAIDPKAHAHKNDLLQQIRTRLVLNVPLMDKPSRLALATQLLTRKKIELMVLERQRQVQFNFEHILRELHDLRAQRNQAKIWFSFAQESLALAEKKFELGHASVMEVTHYSDQLKIAEIQLAKLNINFLNAKTKLDVLMGELKALRPKV